MNKINKLFSIFTLSVIVFGSTFIYVAPVKAGLAEDLAAIQQRLAAIRNKKTQIQTDIANEKNLQNNYLKEINNIRNQINLLDNQINEKALVIDSLEIQIQLMNEEIDKTQASVATAEGDITVLQDETDNRMIDMYMSQKTYSNVNYVFSDGKKDVVKMSLYQKTVQDETNNLLTELNTKKAELAEKEAQLREAQITIERDKATIEAEQLAIEQNKVELDQKKSLYITKRNQSLANLGSTQNYLNSVTFEEQKLLAEQQRIEQIVFDSIKAIPNGTYVTAGTIIGRQGCTGLCTGPHLHFGVKINGGMVNPCTQLPGGVLGNCGSGSSLQWPMSGSFVLTSGYGMRWGKMHYGIDIANYQNDAAIKAAQTGWMYKGFEPCNSSNPLCKNGGANYVIICENKTNCNSGKTTLYWHLR